MARKPAPQGSDRRQQILEAALDVFAEQGLKGATSKDIAERAEVTHGLIYFYFKTKEELFKAAFEYALERALDRLDVAAIVQSDEPPEETLTHLLTRLLETLNTPYMRSIGRLMMHTMAHKDWRSGPLYECKLQVHSSINFMTDEVREYLDRQVALGQLRPVNTEEVAKFLVGGVMSSVRWSQGEKSRACTPHETAAAIADVCVRGLLLTPADAPQATAVKSGAPPAPPVAAEQADDRLPTSVMSVAADA
jgi:AcrR family transcriptional regulator